MTRLRIIFLGLAFIIAISGCENQALHLGDAKATIDGKPSKFINAQGGTTNVCGMYYTLAIVFGNSKGEGFCITLATREKFVTKEYEVKYVKSPDIDNAQMTYNAADHKIYEAVSNKGSGSVILTEITNNYIKGRFYGKFIHQGSAGPVMEINDGEFIANYTPAEPDAD